MGFHGDLTNQKEWFFMVMDGDLVGFNGDLMVI